MSNTWKTALERLPNVVKYLLVIGVVLLISKLSPDNVRFKYNYEVGQVWRYDDFSAPFNFFAPNPNIWVTLFDIFILLAFYSDNDSTVYGVYLKRTNALSCILLTNVNTYSDWSWTPILAEREHLFWFIVNALACSAG